MRKIYITVALIFLASVLLFIGAFIYVDRTGHRVYHFIVSLEDKPIGTIRIDKFVTEEKLIYKSLTNAPFEPDLPILITRMDLSKGYDLLAYSKEMSGSDLSESIYMESKPGGISFVSIYQSRFTFLDNIPARKSVFVFEEGSPVTYLPIIENYNFKRGRSQGFSAITSFSSSLPPMKRFVTLTSIADEYIKIDSHKIKAEHLLLKIRNYPYGNVWVSKYDRSLIMLELPNSNLRVVRTFSPKILEAKEYDFPEEAYLSKEVEFKSGNIKLGGTLNVPKKEGVLPAVLLVGGSSPADRQCDGLFASMADRLARKGFCVLRFDPRGIGSSGGDPLGKTDNDATEDADAAFKYLLNQKEIDPSRAAVIGYAEGALYALRIASLNQSVKAAVLMAPAVSFGLEYELRPENLKAKAGEFKWSDDYANLVSKSIISTYEVARSRKGEWTVLLGYRCFLKKLREEASFDASELIKGVKTPILILQNKKDTETALSESASLIDKMLGESGNKDHALVYFSYLDRFFGRRINDGAHKIHHEVDASVVESIDTWLNKYLPEIPVSESPDLK